jgi:hypothetical protein
MSWKAEVIADSTNTWSGNGLRFAAETEAAQYVADLSYRWTSVRDTRVVESEEPINARWADGKTEHLNG